MSSGSKLLSLEMSQSTTKKRNSESTDREEGAPQKMRERFMKDETFSSRTVKALLLIGQKCLLLILHQKCFQRMYW